jgi:hypothetical protein
MQKPKSNIPTNAISELVEYLYADEQADYEGERDHIFRSVKRVAKWLDTQTKEKSYD